MGQEYRSSQHLSRQAGRQQSAVFEVTGIGSGKATSRHASICEAGGKRLNLTKPRISSSWQQSEHRQPCEIVIKINLRTRHLV